ncbi:hypothetical protein LJC27_02710 [Christensenellaceae bacterium OttesenSCG-928-M15]|nr:hypothetical protein [Christensenellaceae bacterium OttesenSCG-928-M15]
MNSERLKVLEILAKGNISAEEAAKLLDVLDEKQKEATAASEPPRTAEPARHGDDRLRGKKLRVAVNGNMPDMQNMNVDVSIPLVLARFADDIIANCIPHEADEELKKSGINLRSLNIGKIVDTFESLDEDIVNADIDQDDTKLKVRVYVE